MKPKKEGYDEKTKRKLRYSQKINFIVSKINDIPKKIEDSLAIDATLYRLQTSIDAVIDLVAMLTKDKGIEVGDDYANIHSLHKIKVLDNKMADNLVMINGLRNAIVHKYNTFEEDSVIKSIDEIKQIILDFLDKIENEIKAIFKANKK